MLRWVRFLVLLTLLGAAFYLLQFTPRPIPPLGPFLDPFAGFWANGENLDELPERLQLDGLQAPVEVLWDERRVPHVFAQNAHDLYFAQGYVTARDRLWQMDFQTRASAGRLSEILGPQALDFDRYRRRLGMVHGAEARVRGLRQEAETLEAVQAYADGVNAWIDSLTRRTLPLEFKILDYAPEPWTLLHSSLLFEYMAWTLTGLNREVVHTEMLERLGRHTAERLYPSLGPVLDPVIPEGTAWSFEPLPAPPVPESAPQAQAQAGRPTSAPHEPESARGSNNWALSGRRTASGHPLLSSDPHLGMNLPSLWYEIQLVSPESNAYGVSLPGAPSVIIGFNEHVAWGATNAETDVLDWYRMEFRDETGREYRHGDDWLPTRVRTEEIGVRGGETVMEEVLYTHHGPVSYRDGEEPFDSDIPPGAAMRWAGHDASNETGAFLRLNRARNYDDYVKALAYFDCPAQNFAFASLDGTIAIRHNGRLPLRWDGQGRFLSDGSDPRHDWQGWIPKEHLPQVRNPERGYISSANQAPVGRDYPYFLGGSYASQSRGARINEELERMTAATPGHFMEMQMDTLDGHARRMLPVFLAALEDEYLKFEEQAAHELLVGWDYRYGSKERAPILFDAWWREVVDSLWQDLLGEDLRRPGRDITAHRILHPETWDSTPEQVGEVLRATFHAAFAKVVEQHGEQGPEWEWGSARGSNLHHLARIPAFSRLALPTSGRPGVINATGRTFGPSWRMVVALGPQVQAWGILPGGPSGSPGSPYYDASVDGWVRGELHELLYLDAADTPSDRIVGRATLEAGGAP
jgi:penicillin amidase